MRYKLLIVAILLGGMGIIAATIAVGVSHRDVEVVENAYEAGLKYDQVRKRAEALGWSVVIPKSAPRGDAGLELVVLDKNGGALSDAQVRLRTYRLGTGKLQSCECVSRGNGRYSAPVRFDDAGIWTADVMVAVNADVQVFEKSISVR